MAWRRLSTLCIVLVVNIVVPQVLWAQGVLGVIENPQPSSIQSGIAVVSGFVCDAGQVEIEFDGTATFEAIHGSSRADTAGVCGDIDNGFGLLFNWSLLGDGTHTVRALADGVEFDRHTFAVSTLGKEFLTGASGDYTITGFPTAGDTVRVVWQQAAQNFLIRSEERASGGNSGSPPAVLDSPLPGAFVSGVSLVNGWVCDATQIQIALDGVVAFDTPYGTSRGDTASICGDDNNGFGLLFNWNLLGEGVHTVQALADGIEFANVTVNVTTLGVEFLNGASGQYVVGDFPEVGTDTKVVWEEPSQNFNLNGVLLPTTDPSTCATSTGLGEDRNGQTANFTVTNPCLLLGKTALVGVSRPAPAISQTAQQIKQEDDPFMLCAEDFDQLSLPETCQLVFDKTGTAGAAGEELVGCVEVPPKTSLNFLLQCDETSGINFNQDGYTLTYAGQSVVLTPIEVLPPAIPRNPVDPDE